MVPDTVFVGNRSSPLFAMVQLPTGCAVENRCILISIRVARLMRTYVEVFVIPSILHPKPHPREITAIRKIYIYLNCPIE